jgi:hypothetical protein
MFVHRKLAPVQVDGISPFTFGLDSFPVDITPFSTFSFSILPLIAAFAKISWRFSR